MSQTKTVVRFSIQLLDMVGNCIHNKQCKFTRKKTTNFKFQCIGRTDVVEWLIENHYPIDEIINKQDNYGNTPLHYAIRGSKNDKSFNSKCKIDETFEFMLR